MSKKANWTGERMETFVFNESTIEHLHRYALAADLATGKKVLDIACGEGYGSHLLAKNAATVTGMDINPETIAKAGTKYKAANLKFETANAEKIPAPDKSFDLVVSFETLEHLEDHAAMLSEIKRVLAPGGLLVISTPDKRQYSEARNYKNPFHVKELTRNELEALLKKYFANIAIYGQQMTHSSVITGPGNTGFDQYSGNYDRIRKNEPDEPLYLVALASDETLPVLHASLFSGQSILEQALWDKEKMVTGTITYRLGHVLLYPFKLIRNLFKK